MTKTKDNKKIFKLCMAMIDVELKAFGYLPHPAYKPGWEASYQEYVCEWLKEDVSQGIDEILMTWNAKERLIRISRLLTHPTLPSNFTFSDIITDPFEFNYFLNNPYIRLTLMPLARRFWLSRKCDFKLRHKEITNPEETKKSLAKYVIPYLPNLLLAKDSNVKNKSIHIETIHIAVNNG